MSTYGYSDDPYIDEYMYRTHGGRVSGRQPGGIGSSAQRPTFTPPRQYTTDTPGSGSGGGGFSWTDLFGGLAGLAGKAKDAAGLGGVNPLLLALAGIQGFNAADLSKKSTKYATDAFSSVNDSYNERAPLRKAGLQGMLNPQHADLSELTRIRQALPGAAGVGVTGATPLSPMPDSGSSGGGGHPIADGPVAPTPIPTDPNIPFIPATPTPWNDQIHQIAQGLGGRTAPPPTVNAAGKAGLPDKERLRGLIHKLGQSSGGGGLSPKVTV